MEHLSRMHYMHIDISRPVAEEQRGVRKKGNILAVNEDRTSTKDSWLGQSAGNSHSFIQNCVREFVDLRDKQIKEGGVGGMRVHWGVASVQEHKVPGDKEWGPQHRVRDSRSQVESSNFTVYQDRAMRFETKGKVKKKKRRRRSLIHTSWTSTLNLNLSNHQIYFISNKISPLYIWQINNLSYTFLLQCSFSITL